MNAHLARLLVVAVLGGLLAACGGGGASDMPAEAVPAEASESSAALVRYLQTLTATAADTKEPLDLGRFDPKVPEDSEPEPIG
jgi:hypothetical protein